MIYGPRRERGSILDDYCVQLGALAERRHTELALTEAKRQAETAALLAHEAMLQAQAAERAKTKFLANMTHELRTPLNAIIGFSEIIQGAAEQPKLDCPEYARYIHEAGVHLLGIVNGVLDLARIEAGKLQLDEQLVTVGEMVQGALKAAVAGADRKSISLNLRPQLDCIVLVDPGKMNQVLLALLSNAVKFTPEHGHIEVTSRLTGDGGVAIAVADNGIGIPGEYLDRVLEPFGQVEDHLTRQSEGAGLGLPIARALAGLHGGDLVLKSAVGSGTTAEVRLPHHRVQALLQRQAG